MLNISDVEARTSSPPSRDPQSISELARIEVEEPPRKMRLMFGESRIVHIRSDGLRSRIARENLKRTREETEKNKKNITDTDSAALKKTIDDVASGNLGFSCSNTTGSPSTPTIRSTDGDSVLSTVEIAQQSSCAHEEVPEKPINYKATNRTYYPIKPFHGESTLVPHKQRWTYQTACDINAAEQSGDSQMYYIADPFLPMPRDRRNEVCTASRMNYAAQRLDNRKFRGQMRAVNEISNTESVTCEKCGMRYFLESLRMQERISYLQPTNEEDLPTVLFDCPVCKITTTVFA